jgi:transcription initiation factor TFIIIB Brf1 subunit/transcription initiation factor TFIIB
MQTCPQCGSSNVHDERARDEDGHDRGSRTICFDCRTVIRDDVK